MCFIIRRQTRLQAQPKVDVRRGSEREHGNRVRGGRVSGAGRVQMDIQQDGRRRVRGGRQQQQRGGAAHSRPRDRRKRPETRKTVFGAHIQSHNEWRRRHQQWRRRGQRLRHGDLPRFKHRGTANGTLRVPRDRGR